MAEALTARFVATVATFLIGVMMILVAMAWLGEQAAKRQTVAAKRADLTHRIDKAKKQLADLNAKPI